MKEVRHSRARKATYGLHSRTVERVFSDAKEIYAMCYDPYRGLTVVALWVELKFAAMDLNKLTLHEE